MVDMTSIYPEDLRIRRLVALAISGVIWTQSIGILPAFGIDLMKIGLGNYPLFNIIAFIGGLWLFGGIYWHKFQ